MSVRLLALGWLIVAGCDAAPLGHRGDAGAPEIDAAARDTGAFIPADAGSASADAFVPTDAATPCTPTRTSCNTALECGALPDGCPGETYDCGSCGDGTTTWCEILTSMYQTRTYNCIQMVQSANDTWFDPTMFRDTSSWLVLDAHANEYVAAVQACVNGGGRVAIVDPNVPGNEIRVRSDTGDQAENFIVRTYSTGRTSARYTSTCFPAGF